MLLISYIVAKRKRLRWIFKGKVFENIFGADIARLNYDHLMVSISSIPILVYEHQGFCEA